MGFGVGWYEGANPDLAAGGNFVEPKRDYMTLFCLSTMSIILVVYCLERTQSYRAASSRDRGIAGWVTSS